MSWSRFCWLVLREMVRQIVKIEEFASWVLNLLGFFGAASMIGAASLSYHPWLVVPGTICLVLVVIKAAYRVHTSSASGDKVGRVRRMLSELADEAMKLRDDSEVTKEECERWHRLARRLVLDSMGKAKANSFDVKRVMEGRGWTGFESDGAQRFLYCHTQLLQEWADSPALTVLPTYDPDSSD